MKTTLFLLSSLLFIFSCNSNYEKEDKRRTDASALFGEWNNLSIKVEIQSKNNTDSSEIFEVDRAHWEEVLTIKPIRTFFRADSTWNSAHYDLHDSLVYDPSGSWWVIGNKLTMLQLTPSPDTTEYTFSITKDTAYFECMLDWDSDGNKDDRYYGIQKRSSKD